jgi:hypothetical protein
MKQNRPVLRKWACRVSRSLSVVLWLTPATGCLLPDATLEGQDSGSTTRRPDAGTSTGASSDTGVASNSNSPPAVNGADASTDTGVASNSNSPSPVNECASTNLCTQPEDYPCRPLSSGYTCRGQFAEWHMPDAVAGSKYAPSFDVTTTAGAVIDRVTGLNWQQTLPSTYEGCSGRYASSGGQVGDACTWAEAKSYCASLSLAGQGWRLPTKIELESIIDETKYDPAIDRAFFPNAPSERFWTASPVAGSSGSAWLVDFSSGYSFSSGYKYNVAVGRPNRVRCVR